MAKFQIGEEIRVGRFSNRTNLAYYNGPANKEYHSVQMIDGSQAGQVIRVPGSYLHKK